METLVIKEKKAPQKKREAQKKIYTYQEALKASTKYFEGDELAANVWINKYALKDSAGNIYELTPDAKAPAPLARFVAFSP